MLFPCLFLWPCSYLQDKEKESNQSELGIKLPVRNWLPGTPLLSSTHLQHLMLPEKIPHLPEEQIGQVRRIQGSMWRQAQQNTCRYIHYFVNSKSIPYQQGRTYSRFDGLVLTLKFFSRPYTLAETRKPSSPVQE
ncbi:hypothetical protein ACFX1X_004571 [Malus domestica]